MHKAYFQTNLEFFYGYSNYLPNCHGLTPVAAKHHTAALQNQHTN